MWGVLAPQPLIDELADLTEQLLARAQRAGAVHPSITPVDVSAAVWALRGVVQASRIRGAGEGAWRRHLEITLAGFRAGIVA